MTPGRSGNHLLRAGVRHFHPSGAISGRSNIGAEGRRAESRIRAAEAALKAAMRLDRAEMEIKEAMKAQREALGLD